MTEFEIWKSIPGFAGYHVSDLGRVRSFKGTSLLDLRILKPGSTGPARRKVVTLYVEGVPHYRLVARLVCETFIGPPDPPNAHASHQDGDARNDRLANLAWKSPAENVGVDRDRHDRTARGERHYAAILSAANVVEIRRRYAAEKDAKGGRVYRFVNKLAEEYGVTLGCIEDVIYFRKWRGNPQKQETENGGTIIEA